MPPRSWLPRRSWRLEHNQCHSLSFCSTSRHRIAGIAKNADVNVQLSKSANESAPVHSQRSGGFALIPSRPLLENDKDKLLSKFSQRFGIEDARPVHPQHQCLKLRLRRIRVFDTCLTWKGSTSAAWHNLLEFQ